MAGANVIIAISVVTSTSFRIYRQKKGGLNCSDRPDNSFVIGYFPSDWFLLWSTKQCPRQSLQIAMCLLLYNSSWPPPRTKSFASHVLLGTDMISQKHRVFLSAIIISKQVDKIFTSDRLFLKFYYTISDRQNLYFWEISAKMKEPFCNSSLSYPL